MAKILVIDTETGGLDPTKQSILSLGAVVWEDGKLGESFEVYIREPDIQIEQEAMAVNKIDLDWLSQNGLTPVDAVKQFLEFTARNFHQKKNIQLAGHNVNFDVGFIKRLFSLANAKFDSVFSYRVTDTAGILRFLVLAGKIEMPKTSLDAAIAYFGIEIAAPDRHTALADARATGVLLTKLVELVK